jgi:hypothetical protein
MMTAPNNVETHLLLLGWAYSYHSTVSKPVLIWSHGPYSRDTYMLKICVYPDGYRVFDPSGWLTYFGFASRDKDVIDWAIWGVEEVERLSEQG